MQNPADNDTAALFFDVCAQIEGLCAELYHFYSDLYMDHAEISQLWKKTAMEEENHQKQFELAGRIREEIGVELKSDFDRAFLIYNRMNSLLEHVRQNPPDIITALTRAIEMEDSIADLHMANSVHFHDESVRKIFLALQEHDHDHIKSLQHCLSALMLPKAEMAG